MLEPTIVQLLAAVEATGGGQGNLVICLVIAAVAVVAGIWWFVHRYRAARRPAATRAEHEMLREINGQRSEQKAVQNETDVKYLRRGGF